MYGIHELPLLRGFCIATGFAAAVALSAPMAMAQTVDTTSMSEASKAQKDVDIEADQMQVLEDQRNVIFTGNVDARRGNVKLRSNKLVVHYRESKKKDGSEKNEVTHLDATGNVVIITRTQRITGDWAKMDVKANLVNVGGNVVVKQGQTIVKGKKLFVDLNKNISKISGGRVKGSFVPGNN